ncbi:NADH:ubiquinone reductase (Na(+)-transporting) subunit F [Maribacter sp. 2210JD10-5]|uniref:NADH:ubiquinone reductase (Na(+)-transporting) subunit F n=1 Tax=Maribacter sp. 2210JD10-5 TaxID=3386272 RepID=UPI0039BD2D74
METLEKEKLDYSLVGPQSIKAVQQGLAEATWYQPPVPRDKMRELLERKNGPAIIDTLLWFGLLFGAGYLIYALWGTWWVVLPILAYSVLYASSSDSRWHESSHGTAFKTDWMNNVLYEIASFMVFRNSVSWRWSHTRHHSDTQIVGRDPEIAVPRPPDIKGIILNLFALKSAPPEFRKCLLHIIGRLDEEEKQFIPQSEKAKVFLVSRIWGLIYLSVIASAIYFNTWLPLFYIGFPTFLGSYMITVYGLTQHAGLAENVLDHRQNCRTVYMNRIHRFLYWNMNYHLEHHMFPLVPYHNLPKLHALIKDYCPPAYNGIIETYKEIIPALLKQEKDPAYFVAREIPDTPDADIENQLTHFKATDADLLDGEVVVCDANKLPKGEVLRLDYDGKTFAIYQTEKGAYYATDGICTHGSTHLAEGLVIGEQIECPKHNGRFSVVDGSPQRAPVCAALKTYKVSVIKGKIAVDVNNPGGKGLEEANEILPYRVVSNKNVATFIKELVLEPVARSLDYSPGDYVQLEIPVHATAFQDFEIDLPYQTEWKKQNIFQHKSANLNATRRNYSLANNPENSTQLRFNVRIALPPKEGNFHAGIGSSYVFGLKEGDIVKVAGPYGNFHIKNSKREMIYIGGGAGMAPLRSHLSYLFETEKTQRKVSFWYGARSLQELFYEDYFEVIEEANKNFRFEVALSEPKSNDQWASHTGYIHDVVYEQYLKDHPDLRVVEFYLCGPPLMIAACQEMLFELGISEDQIAYDEF